MLATTILLVFASNNVALPSFAKLPRTFEDLGLPIYSQTGPWCWAYTSNSVAEYEYALQKGIGVPLSTGYLVWAAEQTDGLGSGGSNFGRASRGLHNYGLAPLANFGEPTPSGSPGKPAEMVVSKAKSDEEVRFNWIRFWSRDPVSASQFQTIKSELAAGHPVAVGMLWPRGALFSPGTLLLSYPNPAGYFDGHCVVLCGYSDDPAIPGGGSFLFRNSWGSKWANHGYASMPYDLLRYCLNDAYSIRLAPPEVVPPKLISTYAKDAFGSREIPAGVRLREMSRFGQAWGTIPQLTFTPGPGRSDLTLPLQAPATGKYEVLIQCTTAENYGRYAVSINGVDARSVWDGASAGVSLARPFTLGVFNLKQGANTLRFDPRGHSSASSGDVLGLYSIMLARVKE